MSSAEGKTPRKPSGKKAQRSKKHASGGATEKKPPDGRQRPMDTIPEEKSSGGEPETSVEKKQEPMEKKHLHDDAKSENKLSEEQHVDNVPPKEPEPKEEVVTLGPSKSTGAISKKKIKKGKGPPKPAETGKKETLKDVIQRKKAELPKSTLDLINLPDPYNNAYSANFLTRGRTGIVYNKGNQRHKCEWDDGHPENPRRYKTCMERCTKDNEFHRCVIIEPESKSDLEQYMEGVHSDKHLNHLYQLCQTKDPRLLEEKSARYDSVYFNTHTYDVAVSALTAVLSAVDAIKQYTVQNALCLVRPPGHHAMFKEYNGYCFINNAAVAANYAIKKGIGKRIVIFDFDVHHGQGIQRAFYERNDVLYFSIHRYEHGTYWPNLAESDFNFIGKGEGKGYNVNVPLNTTGLTDEDYLAIVFSLLLPICYEFDPDLVIVAAGYDAAIGCPEGRMLVTPGFYNHVIHHLSLFAQGKMVVVLEGGYFLPSLQEGVSQTLKGLLGDPCPGVPTLRSVHPRVEEVIRSLRALLRPYWNCFQVAEPYEITEHGPDESKDSHQIKLGFMGEPEGPPYCTRQGYPVNLEKDDEFYKSVVDSLSMRYKQKTLPVGYVYSETMLKHKPPKNEMERPEKPERISAILQKFIDFGLMKRCVQVYPYHYSLASYVPHDLEYFDKIGETPSTDRDMYSNKYTREAVQESVNSLLTLAEKIMTDQLGAGLAIIRPPGHHAEYDHGMGFCHANNIASVANYLILEWNVSRILIVDFDIHHGNGTQNIFYHTDNVLYISIHKDEDGKFFPPNSRRDVKYDGYGCGRGYNVNIPFSKDKMGDSEYIAAFHNIIVPIGYSYNPEMVLVSAGFDAGVFDPLGGYTVSPETFGHFIHMLRPLAGGKMIVALEGGYNLSTTSYSMALCAKALLGDPTLLPKNMFKDLSQEAIKTIRRVTKHFKRYFPILKIFKKVPTVPVLYLKVNRWYPGTFAKEVKVILPRDKADDSDYVQKESERALL